MTTVPGEGIGYVTVLESERKIGGARWKLSGIAQETPIAYIWARTIHCEGPGCGAQVPLMRSLWLAKKSGRSVALHMLPDSQAKQVNFELIEKKGSKWYTAGAQPVEVKSPDLDGTMRRGSATCPVCGYTTPVERVRAQFKKRQGGAADQRLDGEAEFWPADQPRGRRRPNSVARARTGTGGPASCR